MLPYGSVSGNSITRFAMTGEGDVRRLTDSGGDLRLRVGDYRVRFVQIAGQIVVKRVLPRDKAYP